MISNEENEKEEWHYVEVTKLSALLCRKTLKIDVDFYCLNGSIHSFRAENKLKSHEKVCKDKEFWLKKWITVKIIHRFLQHQK